MREALEKIKWNKDADPLFDVRWNGTRPLKILSESLHEEVIENLFDPEHPEITEKLDFLASEIKLYSLGLDECLDKLSQEMAGPHQRSRASGEDCPNLENTDRRAV